MKEYIDKAVITAEVKRLAEVGRTNASCFDKYPKEKAIWLQQADVCDRILSFLNTLEVKEVDLEKENLPISNSLTEEGLFTFEDGGQAIITKLNTGGSSE